MLKRLLALSMLLVILEIPLNEWRNCPEETREGIRKSATTSFMRKLEPGDHSPHLGRNQGRKVAAAH